MRIATMLTRDVGMRIRAQVYLLAPWLCTPLCHVLPIPGAVGFTLEAFPLLYRNSPCLR